MLKIGIIGIQNFNIELINNINSFYITSVYIENKKKKYVKDIINLNNLFFYEDINKFIYSLDKKKIIIIFDLNDIKVNLYINKIINYLNYNDLLINMFSLNYKISINNEIFFKKNKINYINLNIINYKKINKFIINCNNSLIFYEIKKIFINIYKNKKIKFFYIKNYEINTYIFLIYNLIKNYILNLIWDFDIILKKIFNFNNKCIKKFLLKINNLLKINEYIKIYKSYNIKIKKNIINNNKLLNNISKKDFFKKKNNLFIYLLFLIKKNENNINNNIIKNKKINFKYVKDIKNSFLLSIIFIYKDIIESINKFKNTKEYYKIYEILEINNFFKNKKIFNLYKLIKKEKKDKNYINLNILYKNYFNSLKDINILCIKNNCISNFINIIYVYNKFI